MSVRLLLGVALVANIFVLAVNAESENATTTSISPDSPTPSESSDPAETAISRRVKCRKIKKCPQNEIFTYCTKSIQRPQYCVESNEVVPRRPCWEEGCVCKENYLRVENGTCVPAEQCPITCGENEILDSCPAECDSDYCPTEDVETRPCVIPDVCPPPKCKCGFNHRRISNGSCIHAQSCPVIDCIGPNEEFVHCPPLCPTDDCSQATPTGECPTGFGNILLILPCNPQCRCVKGFWRLDGVCVPYGQCPGVCPENERYSTCIEAECRALNCTQKDQSVPCVRMDPKYCTEGCVCTEGYLRNKEGVCVLEDKCESSSCPANEELVPCMQGVCRAKYCSERGEEVPCPDIPPEQCDSGCICKEFFLRNVNGNCVPEDECDSEDCPDNERYSTCIEAECRALNCTQKDKSVPCVRMDPKYCSKGCVCTEGYLRNKEGVCVLEDKCESSSCPANEELVPCMQGVCRAKYCSERGEDVPCPDIPPEQCDSGCICKEFFLRDVNGNCVPEDECDSEDCPDNERYSTCIQGECRALNCTQKDQSVPCIKIDPKYCIKGCVCDEGYLRNKYGVCVPEDKCESDICPENEVYSECIQGGCSARNCSQKGKPVPCIKINPFYCRKGCVCDEGYLRNKDGDCVPEDECETEECPDNEKYSTCIQSECRALNCSQKDEPVPCVDIDEENCIKGCVCENGYLRNKDGLCVLENECETNEVCPENERYSACKQSECRPLDCDEKGQPGICVDLNPEFCLKGCVCEKGYLRDQYGLCVLEEDCKPPVCPPNEEYSTCAQALCRAVNCTQRGKPIACPSILPGYCEKACVCKNGFLRNADGDCIPEDQCTCEENEILVECPTSCNTDYCPYSADEVEECYGKTDPCVPTCKCKFNYRRSNNGSCIPTQDCPPFDCSGKPNEEYVACPPLCPSDECGKPRLEGRCPFRIGIRLECKPKCQCKDGYGRVNGTCVPFEECPNLCPDNEEYSPCVQRTCRPQNCSERDVAMETCPTCDGSECTRGCVCKKGYYRNDKGVCVSYEECAGPMCPNAHEVFTPNFKECPPNICNSLVARYRCPENQTEGPGCICESGYLRLDLNSSCVPICDCPEMKNSPDC